MTESVSELPGLTFHLEAWQEQGMGEKRFVDIRIRAEVEDWALAEKVKQKFDGGMKIYTVEDFKAVMIKVLKKDNEESEGKLIELQAALTAKTREAESLKAELVRINASFSFLG